MCEHIVSVFSDCYFSGKGLKKIIESIVPREDVIYIPPETRVNIYGVNPGAANLGKFVLNWTEKNLNIEIAELRRKESLYNINRKVNKIFSVKKNSALLRERFSKLSLTEKSILKLTISGLSPHEIARKLKLPLYAVYGLGHELLVKLNLKSREELFSLYEYMNIIIIR